MITRYHPVLSVPAATIRGMAGDPETVTAAAAAAAGGDLVPWAGARPPGPAVIAAELLARTRAELPVLAGLGEREELLAAAWLASLRAPRTRRADAADVRGWLGWLAERGTDVLDAGRVHVDVWAAGQQDQGAEAASVRRRLSALSSFYRYCAAHDLVDRIPTVGVSAADGAACVHVRGVIGDGPEPGLYQRPGRLLYLAECEADDEENSRRDQEAREDEPPVGTCGCRKPMPPGDIHESRLRRGRAAGRGSGPGR